MNLFLDDERQPKDAVYWEHNDERCWVTECPLLQWDVVKSYDEFVTKITKDGLPKVISFDHDLDTEHYIEGYAGLPPAYKKYKTPTGYQCLMWLMDYCRKQNKPLPKCYCHSFNTHGRNYIFLAIINYNKEFYAKEKNNQIPNPQRNFGSDAELL